MSHYHDPSDSKFGRNLRRETPDINQAFLDFDAAVFAEEGREIPLKYRELIATAVGISTQCVYCIEAHSTGAAKAGATQKEIAEAVWVATALRAGGAYSHGRLAFKFTEGLEGLGS